MKMCNPERPMLLVLTLSASLFTACSSSAMESRTETPVSSEVPRSAELGLDIPRLDWTPRSDWMNVRESGAVGDGLADDTAAIQALYDRLSAAGAPRVVYFPPGQYRITSTLRIVNDASGSAVIGHGRDTVLVWDGEKGGSMYWSDGVHRVRYVGLSFDGRGVAGTGSDHRSTARYETHILYQHCAFMNLEQGVAVHPDRKAAAAEVWYENCLFRNNQTGVQLNNFNDYDHWFTGCAFVDNGTGIDSKIGHFHVYNSHFIRSRRADVRTGSPAHPPSIRWSTSHNSHRFYENGVGRHTLPITLQNNWIEGWTAADGAIRLGQRGPSLVFDNIFANPPDATPPIRLVNSHSTEPWTEQLLVHANNQSEASGKLIDPGPFSRISEVHGGTGPLVVRTGTERFFRDKIEPPGKVFDAKRDFGAKGDGSADDTEAVQRTIDAAREHGSRAVAYLPFGTYHISRTLEVTGADYAIESTGFKSKLVWAGEPDGVMMQVVDPRNLCIEHLELEGPATTTRIRQTSAGQPSFIYYNNLHVTSVYSKVPGIELVELPANAVVRMGIIAGFVRAVDSGQASVLGVIHVGRLQVEGAKLPKTGFFGFLYHNAAVHEYVVIVKDNQNLVIGDLYHESNDRFLLAEGGEREDPGRITIGLSKSSTHEADTIHINNYAGRISLFTGSWQNQRDRAGGHFLFRHQGEAPVDLWLVGNSFAFGVPQIESGPGMRVMHLENALWAFQNARSLPNNVVPEQLTAVAEALDDFRRLGEIYARPEVRY